MAGPGRCSRRLGTWRPTKYPKEGPIPRPSDYALNLRVLIWWYLESICGELEGAGVLFVLGTRAIVLSTLEVLKRMMNMKKANG